MKIKINKKEYEAKEGETVLDVCRRERIKIPTLCSWGKLKKEAACRLCLVEIEGKLVTSCTTEVNDGLAVIAESEKIKKAREINMELLWSDHAGKCANCEKNRACELQNMAEEYKIENFHFVPRRGEITNAEKRELAHDNQSRVVVEDQNPAIYRTTEYCVECRRCINICPVKAYGFNHRAGDVVVGTPYNEPLDCLFCGACVKYCPTAALIDKGNLDEIRKKLDNLNVLAVAIIDPAVLESIENEFGEIKNREELAGLLRALGFEKVFGLDWALNLYAQEIAEELKNKNNKKTLINSNCIAFKRFVKKYYPELKNNITKLEIPDEIIARTIKEDYARKEKINPKNIFIVAISSCVAKKSETHKNLDEIITVRELGRLARKNAINLTKITDSDFDKLTSGDFQNGESLVKSGGLSKKVSEYVENDNLKIIKANSMEEIKKALKDISARNTQYDFMEGLICPEGCVHGGGQSIDLK